MKTSETHRVRKSLLAASVVALCGFVLAAPAGAVIKPDQDLGSRYGIYPIARQILIGKATAMISGLTAARRAWSSRTRARRMYRT